MKKDRIVLFRSGDISLHQAILLNVMKRSLLYYLRRSKVEILVRGCVIVNKLITNYIVNI